MGVQVFGLWITDFGVWVKDFGFRVRDFGFGVKDVGFREFGFWVRDIGVGVRDCKLFWHWGWRFRNQGLRFWCWGSGFCGQASRKIRESNPDSLRRTAAVPALPLRAPHQPTNHEISQSSDDQTSVTDRSHEQPTRVDRNA